MSWQASFLAMSAAIGTSVDDAAAPLGVLRDPSAHSLAAALRSESKSQRAQALAVALGVIAREIGAMDMRGDA